MTKISVYTFHSASISISMYYYYYYFYYSYFAAIITIYTIPHYPTPPQNMSTH